MVIWNKFRTANQVYARSGLRGLSLKIAAAYGGEPINNYILSSWGFERCTLKNDIEMIYVPASHVKYNKDFDFIPLRGEDAVTGVSDGSWDLLRRPFEESSVYNSLFNFFVNGSEWSQTSRYNRGCREIQSGNCYWGKDSINQLDDRFNRVENLYESIRDTGFKTQLELYNRDGGSKSKYQRRMGDFLIPNELRVAIDRNGELIRIEHGHHRTSIMKILDRDTPMPAIVQFKHTDFGGKIPYKNVVLDETHDLVNHSPIQ